MSHHMSSCLFCSVQYLEGNSTFSLFNVQETKCSAKGVCTNVQKHAVLFIQLVGSYESKRMFFPWRKKVKLY